MDKILEDSTLVFLSYYNADGPKDLAFSIIGEENDFPKEIEATKKLKIDVVLGDLQSNKG